MSQHASHVTKNSACTQDAPANPLVLWTSTWLRLVQPSELAHGGRLVHMDARCDTALLGRVLYHLLRRTLRAEVVLCTTGMRGTVSKYWSSVCWLSCVNCLRVSPTFWRRVLCRGGHDDYVMQSSPNYIVRLGLVKAELKCDQEPSTLDVANALSKRCQSTVLILTATPKGSKGSLRRGGRANFTIQGQVRAFREAVSMKHKTEVGPDHVLMGWMVRHCAWVVNNCQVKGTGKTPYRSIRGKDYTGEVVPFGEVCLGRNHSGDGAKLNMRWMRGVLVGKLDRTDEFLLLTPTGANEDTLCETSWRWQCLGFAILESVWWQSVECEEHAARTNNPTRGWFGKRQTCEKSVFATEHFG